MSPRIQALDDHEAPPSTRPVLERMKQALGMVPNLHRTLANAPAALRGYVDMASALGGGVLSAKLRERIAVAVAGHNGCSYCASAHTALGKGAGLDEDELQLNLASESSDPQAAVVLGFVRALLETRGAVSDAALSAVRAAGFSDAAIVEMVAHVGLNTFTNTINNLARTTIDFPEVELTCAR